jgi:anti-sigma regulatory factor (Ser/Thr protein kinase)
MYQQAPNFSHEALLYEGSEGLLAGAVPFLREGIAAGEPILVAIGAEKIALLRAALGADADRVQFVDMAVIGHNPARIIPAWSDFLAAHHRPGGGIRGIGEPIWSGRSATELVECQLHESLLNLAFAEVDGFRLLCPYDTAALDPGVIHEACCSHPATLEGAELRPSRAYREAAQLLAPYDSPLPPPPVSTRILAFELDGLSDVRRLVHECAARAGLAERRSQDLVLAVGELAANSIRHGGGHGVLRSWRDNGSLICEVRDRGHIHDPLAGRHRPTPEQLSGRGLWIANSVCDLLQVRSGAQGTAIRAHMEV